MKIIRFFSLIIICCISIVAYGQKLWTLEDCINHALEYNLDIHHKNFEIDVKEQDVRMAKNERLPAVNSYLNVYSNFGNSQDIFGTIQRNDNLNSNIGITADIVLYNFGTLRNRIRKTASEQQAIILEKEILKRQLTIKVIQAYFDILLKEALVVAKDSSITHALRILDRVTRTTEIGTTAKIEVYEAKATLAHEQQQYESLKTDVMRARLHLAQLMSIEHPDLLNISPQPLPTSYTNILNFNDAVQATYSIHPTIHRLDEIDKTMEIESSLIKSQKYPNIKGSFFAGSTFFTPLKIMDNRGFLLQTRDNFAQQISITTNIPIFNKKRTHLQLKQLKILRDQLTIEKLREKQEIRYEVQQLFFDFQNNKKQSVLAKEVVQQTEKAMTFAKSNYESGRISIYDYNNSRNQYIQAQNAFIHMQYSALFSYIILQYQTTGHWQND